MMRRMLGIVVLAALCLSKAYAGLGVVLTEGGMVEGSTQNTGLFRYVDVFKGIPFAAPPGRFQKPVRHPGWDGVLKVNDYNKRCMQVNLLQNGVVGSEDCLYLNIWVPQGRTVSTGLPVMVWIYGGGFLKGASEGANFLNNYLYDGKEIADRGNVIVVTLSYRLGTLGFLSSGDSELPGNYGLWDQQAGIGWVHRNIKAFGGDPNNITIFGESAGGTSVNFQILSPHNKGLIRRAISQSGVALCPWAVNRNPRAYAVEIANKVGCPTDGNMVSCLKRTDPNALTVAGDVVLQSSASNPVVHNLKLSPVIDGDFLPAEPDQLFHNAAEIDYIAGVNDMDGHLFATVDIPSINNILVSTPIGDVKKLADALTRDKGTAAGAAAYAEYTSAWGNSPSDSDIKKTVVALETDYIFLVPTQAALYLHAEKATTGRTYSYLFSEPSRNPLFPTWMGADHAEDLQFVFGKPFSTPLGYFPRHRDISGYMIAYWTNFARTGDPNRGELSVPVTWPEFTDTGHKFLELNYNTDANSVKQRLRMRYVYYWTSVYGSLPSVKS
ncbi:bile salt-activated lipase-like [Triplophysa dalaica]|uniref:bile salt-activated lipase-like n=1 Tax=Triplophysa dalaica TaxID=1582913 RepID=UPI0024DFC54E|nr:bile salt-activated lipase-like [Triplophysa dalaica]